MAQFTKVRKRSDVRNRWDREFKVLKSFEKQLKVEKELPKGFLYCTWKWGQTVLSSEKTGPYAKGSMLIMCASGYDPLVGTKYSVFGSPDTFTEGELNVLIEKKVLKMIH